MDKRTVERKDGQRNATEDSTTLKKEKRYNGQKSRKFNFPETALTRE